MCGLTLLANNHSRYGLYFGSIATPHHPSVCHRDAVYHLLGHHVRTLRATSVLHYCHLVACYNRLHHPSVVTHYQHIRHMLTFTFASAVIANKDPKARPGVSYLGTFFAACGIYPSVALVLCWPAINVSGQTKRATANAMQISIGNLGAVLGAQLYRPNTAPRYVLGHSFALGYLCMNIVVVTTLWLILNKENRQKEQHLVEHPETAGFHDSDEDLRQGDRHPRWKFQA